MNFAWFVAVVFALLAVVAGQQCPSNFALNSAKKCVADRPVHGSCPQQSEYDANINKCVYGKKLK
ncbi:uncharacterized protein LOC142219905 [Haematobia irritans]|uniref:uncharacterized protein LOC142219905 n=1 Tax=Haematobia irritans TaxID=7368 RepID=UPI003F4F414A